MNSSNQSLAFFLRLSKLHAILASHFSKRLGGLGFNEFAILLYLNEAPNQSLSYTDLGSLVGLSPAEVTRQLVPMEKIGLISREANVENPRLSQASLAPGGAQKLTDAMDDIDPLMEELLPPMDAQVLQYANNMLDEIADRAK